MTNDELERVMNFIIERQERVTAQYERIAAQHEQFSAEMREQQELARVLLDTQAALTESVIRLTTKDADHDERIARFERSYIAITELLRAHDSQLGENTTSINGTNDTVRELVTTVAQHDTQIGAMTDGINNLSRIVERYITARGANGGKA